MSDFNKQYSYDEMSNKVIRSDRKRHPEEVNTNPSSLVGQISVKDMGTRVQPEKVPEAARPKTTTSASTNPTAGSRKAQNFSYSSSYENISYHPSNEETAHIFDLIMTQIRSFLPDTSHDVILSASDTVLEILKQKDTPVSDKKNEVIEILGQQVNDVELNELINLSNRITDYETQTETVEEEEGNEVAVIFDEEDDEEDEAEDAEQDDEETGDPEEGEQQDIHTETVIQTETESAPETKTSIPLHEIDKFYLQRKLTGLLEDEDPSKIQAIHSDLLSALGNSDLTTRDLENELMELMNYDHFEFVQLCTENRWRIYFKLRWLDSSDKDKVLQQLEDLNLQSLALELTTGVESSKKRKLSEDTTEDSTKKLKPTTPKIRDPKIIDLEALSFDQGSHLMSNTKVKLPQGSYQQSKKSYDTIHIPPPESPPISADEKLVAISELPPWAAEVFPSSETSSLNRIQSKVYPSAFQSDENLLLCAPTGAGKTNVAMLTVLRTIDNYRDPQTGKIDLKKFKIVYIAPLKALVQEQMREFARRLTPTYGIVVNELTGDSNLSKQQISETQILVTTPEKWDIITRKSSDVSSTASLTKLIIIDEIHLLHDERGPVLESIVSRTLRHQEKTGEPIRLVGLSATLPNYQDVAQFLRVDFQKGLFYFDASYRPCPLAQQFIGIKEKKAIKKLNAMNEACLEKLTECMTNNHQLIIFVHSRKDTHKTAKWLKEKLEESDQSGLVLKPDSGSFEILKQEGEMMKNRDLKEIVPSGFGIHHAGLNKQERSVVEDLFAQGHIKVLVSTATLAWGVNLPAHTVVIKGTETYSPEKGTWVQLSPQDILQMLGRAGRPRYDKSGEGIIITTQDELQYYLAVLNQQLPIESQFIAKLVDNLNAEIVLGSIKSRDDGISWLGYTYLYIRMLKSPGLYHVGDEKDPALKWKRTDLIHSALTILQKNKLVEYDPISGDIKSTELGKIASHYYINYETMNMYNSKLKPWLTEIDILKIFASSGEFRFIPVRQEEKLEVSKLIEKCPIPIKEDPNDPMAKTNVLLQTYISRLSLDGFALMADMIYITQSAGRLLRAIFEIVFKKGWSSVAKICLNLCKMVEKRMWLTSSPFRQFGDLCPREIIRTTESSHLPWVSYFHLSAVELSEALNLKGHSQLAYDLIQKFPKLDLNTYCQPITPTIIRVQVQVVPNWEWSPKVHGNAENFYVLVEDCDGENILFSDHFSVKREYIGKEHFLDFTVELKDPKQPNYFISFVSEKWLHSEWKIPLELTAITAPKKGSSFTELLDIQNVPTSSLPEEFDGLFEFNYFNKFQSQVFTSVFNTNESILIGLSKGSGKTVCAELALLNNWKQNKGRAVYINPSQEKIDSLTKVWSKKFKHLEKEVAKLTGDTTKDIKILNTNHLVLATPTQFNTVAKRWRQRKVIHSIELLIADDIHSIGGTEGTNYEVLVSRMRLVESQFETGLRIVGLSSPLINSRDLGEWIGATKHNIYSFDPINRFNKIEEIKLQSSDIHNYPSFINWGSNITYDAVFKNGIISKSLVFVATRRQALDIGSRYIQSTLNDSISALQVKLEELEPYLTRVNDSILKRFLSSGIAYYHRGMNSTDKLIVEKLFENDIISVIIATKDASYFAPSASNVIILGTQEYEGKEHRYVDYTIDEVSEMIGCAGDSVSNKSKVLLLTTQAKLKFYQQFLGDGLPVESHLNTSIHDYFIDEIATRSLKSNQDCIDWITFTFFYRRLRSNPSFYDVKDTSNLGISEYLSELLEEVLKELEEGDLVEIEEEAEDEEDEEEDEETLSPTNATLISSHYSISYSTMKIIAKLTNKIKTTQLFEILTSCSEFETLNIRENEPNTLNKIYEKLPIKSSSANSESPYFKAFVLLQAHLLRIPLPFELQQDQKLVLKTCLNLISGCIDILSSEGYLNAIHIIDLSQMIVQATWFRDSPLKQIPNFDEAILSRCKKQNIETVYDIMSLEDEERDDVLQLKDQKLYQVAEFVNKYPNIDIHYTLDLSEPVISNEEKEIEIVLERDEDMDDLTVVANHLPFEKEENWWIIIGDSATKQLYAIKKTTIAKEKQALKLRFSVPNSGTAKLSIYCMCDSYIDADKEVEFVVEVQ